MNMLRRKFMVDEEHPLPYPDPKNMHVHYTCNTPLDVLGANVDHALRLGLPRFFGETVKEKWIEPDPELGETEGSWAWHVPLSPHPIAIVAGGPSLRQTVGRIKDFKTVMVAGSSYDYVVDHGVVPDYCVLLDGIPQAIDWLKRPNQTTTYLVASQNDPVMFDYLQGYRVHLWHAMGLDHRYGDEPSIGGGSTTALRCIELAFLMGYPHQHFFGLDSCYAADGASHAYDDWDNPQKISITVHTDHKNRVFHTDTGLMGQAENFIETFKVRKELGMQATVHGDGLIAETVRYDYGSEGIRVAA